MPLIAALLRRHPPLDVRHLVDMIECGLIGGEVGHSVRGFFSVKAMVRAAQEFVAREGLKLSLRQALTRLRDSRKKQHEQWFTVSREDKELVEELDALLGESPVGIKALVEPGEPWADAVLETLEKSGAKWTPLIRHAAAGEGSKPPGKWLKEAKKLIDAIGGEEFARCAGEWMPLATKPRTTPLREDQLVKVWQTEFDLYSNKNEDVLKGLVWACAAAGDEAFAGDLGALAEWCYAKIRTVGPRSPKIANACLIALIMLPGQAPRAELSRLKAKVKQPTGRKMIEKALGKSAAAAGMSPDDLEELAVGNYGLSGVGAGEQKIGAFTARIAITPSRKVGISFTDSTGKARASIPAELKKEGGPTLRQFEQNCKDLAKMLPTLRDRLERMPMNRRELPVAAWRERYLDHPVVGVLAQRLIWDFGDGAPGAWHNGRIVDANDKPLKIDDKAKVQLWHPSGASAADVLAWRNWLIKHDITQPFKQAHREVYLLTDAERRTDMYSNRFAAHILRQNVLAALCTQRGWKYRLMGSWDGGDDTMPTIDLPRWELRVEFWLAGGEVDEGIAAAVARNVFTDQVRFYRAGEEAPMPLAEVPPLMFSEVMRDVDLFVGVTSIGNDPNWHEGGGRAAAYWRQYSFGDLNQTAQTRREVLQKLIPRLKIADKCSFADKYLVVRGQKRTYKIHLGSSNILMEPNDQYLCIVPDAKARAGADGGLFLPFEGDSTLSVILSKALLLAEDDKIKDPTITRQIG
jgi:hypothetical protein